MLKGKIIFITPEIPSSFSRSLKELSIFRDSDLVVTADWIGQDLDYKQIVSHVQRLLPTLIITSDKILAAKLQNTSTCKIFLLCEGYQGMLQNWIFELKTFLTVRGQIFIS